MSLETGLTVDKQPAAPGSVLGTHHHNETFRSLIASSSSSATTSTSSIITSASTEAYNYEHDNEHVHIINNGNILLKNFSAQSYKYIHINVRSLFSII